MVTVKFFNKILPKMSSDFAEKMGFLAWPPENKTKTGSSAEKDVVHILLVKTVNTIILKFDYGMFL